MRRWLIVNGEKVNDKEKCKENGRDTGNGRDVYTENCRDKGKGKSNGKITYVGCTKVDRCIPPFLSLSSSHHTLSLSSYLSDESLKRKPPPRAPSSGAHKKGTRPVVT